jgi:hypothetical protein
MFHIAYMPIQHGRRPRPCLERRETRAVALHALLALHALSTLLACPCVVRPGSMGCPARECAVCAVCSDASGSVDA